MTPFSYIDPYATHLPATMTAALQSGLLWPGSKILELGCGHYSTPLLSSIAKIQNRPYQIITSDAAWTKPFEQDIQDLKIIPFSSWHNFHFDEEYGVVLVDHEELVKDRFAQLFKLSKKAKVVIFHDANRIAEQDICWTPIYWLYQYVYFFDRYRPTTVLLSNEIDPASWFSPSY